MCSALPVYRGELQCRLLGMAIEAYTQTGTLAMPGEAGELVCLQPFPCQPVGFWPLPGFGTAEAVEAAAVRYRQAYFSEYPDVWCRRLFSYDLGLCLIRFCNGRPRRSYGRYTLKIWQRGRSNNAWSK
jgi:acyl-coenzyme A synthetase/AMP-(fatty) acid ligase